MVSLLNEQITLLLESLIGEMGFELLEVSFSRSTLQLVIERLDEEGVTIEDCVAVSKSATTKLDVEDLMNQPYSLEVTSPGIDRLLTKLKHFERFKGFDAQIEAIIPLKGRTKLQCRLCGIDSNNTVKLKVLDKEKLDDQETSILLPDIKKAKLILTDALIKASKEQQI